MGYLLLRVYLSLMGLGVRKRGKDHLYSDGLVLVDSSLLEYVSLRSLTSFTNLPSLHAAPTIIHSSFSINSPSSSTRSSIPSPGTYERPHCYSPRPYFSHQEERSQSDGGEDAEGSFRWVWRLKPPILSLSSSAAHDLRTAIFVYRHQVSFLNLLFSGLPISDPASTFSKSFSLYERTLQTGTLTYLSSRNNDPTITHYICKSIRLVIQSTLPSITHPFTLRQNLDFEFGRLVCRVELVPRPAPSHIPRFDSRSFFLSHSHIFKSSKYTPFISFTVLYQNKRLLFLLFSFSLALWFPNLKNVCPN
jgi:hypothetical protein